MSLASTSHPSLGETVQTETTTPTSQPEAKALRPDMAAVTVLPPHLMTPVALAGKTPSTCRDNFLGGGVDRGPGSLTALLQVTQLEVRDLVGPGLGPKSPDAVPYFSMISREAGSEGPPDVRREVGGCWEVTEGGRMGRGGAMPDQLAVVMPTGQSIAPGPFPRGKDLEIFPQVTAT